MLGLYNSRVCPGARYYVEQHASQFALMHPLCWSTKISNHVSEKTFFFLSASLRLSSVITTWGSICTNCYIKSWNLSGGNTPPPKRSLGRAGGKLSVVRHRQVMAEWPNCLSCCLSRPANLPAPSSSLRSTDSLVQAGLSVPSEPGSSLASTLRQ